jgi:ligand-binding sensor domain-containing protein/two-component sensor histidine kinase
MRQRSTLLLVFFNCLCLISISQQVNFIKYTVQDGLVANPVRCIYQDSKGFIWIGTFEGLSRYDGYKFTAYTNANGLSHNFINSIIEVNGKLLIGENNGAVDVIENNSIQKRLMAASAVNIISPYENRLLFTTDASGVYEYKNDTIISPSQGKTGTALGHFLPINDSFLLCDGVDDNLIVYRKDLSVHSSLKVLDMHFNSLFRDSKKRIWACTGSGLKLLEFRPGKDPFLTFAPLPQPFNSSSSSLINSAVISMIEEEDGSFWIGTIKGLVRIFPDGNSYVYNEKDGLPSAIIYTLYIDREENLWIGTSLGLAKWTSKNNVVFYNTENKEFRNDVSYLLPDKGKIVLKTDHGLQHFDFATKEFRNVNKSTAACIPVKGTSPLLVHYKDRIGILDSAKNIIIPLKKLDTTITDVFFASSDANGTIFLGTLKGLFAIQNTSVKQVLPHRVTSLITDNNGNTIAGTWLNGLFRIAKQNSGSIYDVKDITSFTRQSQIRSLYLDGGGNIWVGTRYSGAYCVTEKANGTVDVQHLNRQSGLMSDWVTSFGETTNGDMWIGNYLGLDKLVKLQSGYRVFNFGRVVNCFAEIKSIVPLDDDNWICVANTGIAIFKDENLHREPPLQTAILSISLGVGENKLTTLSPTEKISLKPNQNVARFEFSALGFINERQLLYSYRLKGSNDSTWSKPENIHEASYASLSPGHYTFEVKTIGWNGEDGTPAAFSFHINMPFWKQWWFIALGALVVLILFYALYRYRIRQLVRLQNVRNSIATDLHDDIGSSLTNISILSELSNKNLSKPEKAQPFLQRISEEVQASSQAMDDIIWSVNSHNDSLQETMARMRRYAAELFDNSETGCHLQLEEDSANKKLSMEQRRDVYLIYKEVLNNIHKHAHANNIWIDVSQEQNHLFMQIKDDGKGFNTDHITHRNGLKNLRSRVEKWFGKIKIQSEENKGTTIEIRIPLKDP